MNIGEEIKRLRIDKGLTQRSLGRYAGVSPAYISQLETGSKVNVSATILAKLAERLDVPAKYLLGAAGFLPEQEDEVSLRGLQIAKQFDKMSDDDKAAYEHLIRSRIKDSG